ncbi:NAD-dependent epimerase/dehydratase family protein [Pyxidicoccus parkwayensis]|uniref:NAD-dependent epimerase/dehydratase family protein n=1 Tax=Pyxidicoccus parkwayensis TaxID=2813578 RepID=A0ABX7P024_9BACT|nr:NAD-dependent epimerase/dehydratase family protein [Pyxidicoccus parkwaysis]QSQ23934.1 NAD-dependent epimerase/dehydratase family protein [Pyxidicoccus parkwaysis]
MRVLMTGATGYIGSRVAARLSGRGHTVVAAVRDADAAERLKTQQTSARQGAASLAEVNSLADSTERLRAQEVPARPLIASLAEVDRLAAAARNCDAVVHLAFDFSSGVEGAIERDRAVVAAFASALRNTDKPLVVTSATGLLGNTGPTPVGESHPPEAGFRLAIRHRVEVDVLSEAAKGVRASVIRVPILVHTAAGGGPIERLITTARRTGTSYWIGSGENRLPCVHLDDLVDLYVRALEAAPAGHVYNSNGGDISLREFAETVGRAVGVPARSLAPEQAVDHFGPFFATLLPVDNRVSNARACTELGWAPYRARPSLAEDLTALGQASRA